MRGLGFGESIGKESCSRGSVTVKSRVFASLSADHFGLFFGIPIAHCLFVFGIESDCVVVCSSLHRVSAVVSIIVARIMHLDEFTISGDAVESEFAICVGGRLYLLVVAVRHDACARQGLTAAANNLARDKTIRLL